MYSLTRKTIRHFQSLNTKRESLGKDICRDDKQKKKQKKQNIDKKRKKKRREKEILKKGNNVLGYLRKRRRRNQIPSLQFSLKFARRKFSRLLRDNLLLDLSTTLLAWTLPFLFNVSLGANELLRWWVSNNPQTFGTSWPRAGVQSFLCDSTPANLIRRDAVWIWTFRQINDILMVSFLKPLKTPYS